MKIQKRKKLPIVKHLEDIDDLSIGRDTSLVPGQKILVNKLADSIYQYYAENSFKILIFQVSPKKRAQEAARLVQKNLSERNSGVRIILEVNQSLREIDQGEFILPSNYQPGNYFQGLKIAGSIFSSETFSDVDNLTYRYGSPFVDKKVNKYPELKKYFRDYGENYKEVLIRFYTQVINFSEFIRRLDERNAGMVVFTHSQPHQIFTDLSIVARMIISEGFNLKTGDLPRLCWNLYKSRERRIIPFGDMTSVCVDHIYNNDVIQLLEREVEFLGNLS